MALFSGFRLHWDQAPRPALTENSAYGHVYIGLLKTTQNVYTRPEHLHAIRTPIPSPGKNSEKLVFAQSGPYKMHKVKALQLRSDPLEMRLWNCSPFPSTQVCSCTELTQSCHKHKFSNLVLHSVTGTCQSPRYTTANTLWHSKYSQDPDATVHPWPLS